MGDPVKEGLKESCGVSVKELSNEKLMMLAMCFCLSAMVYNNNWLGRDIAKELRDELTIRIGI